MYQPRGSGFPRPRPSMRPDYEDIQPTSSWKQEQGSDVLLVFIPGFTRDQVKVSVETSNMTVKVYGHRPLGNNKWSRFNEDFNIPEDCNMSAISGKFDNETLTITMPKKIVDSPPVGPEVKEVEAKTTQDAPLTSQKAAADDKPKSQMINQQRDEKSTAGSPNTQNAAIELKPQKGQEEIHPPKATPPASTSKQTDGKIVGSTNDENVVQKAMEKKERIETIEKAPGEKERESSEQKKGSMAAKEVDPGFVKTEETAASGFNLEKYMKALKDLPMKIREERQSAVIIGVAIALIVALGAYIFNFGPSGKARN